MDRCRDIHAFLASRGRLSRIPTARSTSDRFLEAYQRVQPLTIGELWALAITLRITLVENLRRLAEAIVARLSISQLADNLADRILGTDDHRPEPASLVLKSLDQVPWSTTFAVQLAQRLRDHDPNATPALRWLNERLETEGITIDQIVRAEVQQQSGANVTVRNVITSMRLVSMINWAEFFESVSPVDAIMRTEATLQQWIFLHVISTDARSKKLRARI